MSNQNKKFLIPALAVGAGVAIGALFYYNNRQRQPTLLSDIDYLTKELCQERRRLLSKPHVEYDLLLVFPDKEDFYYGEIEIKFELGVLERVTLDFQKKGVTVLAINKRSVQDPRQIASSDQLVLPKEFLQVGENVVQIKFKNQFDKNTYGLIKADDGTIHAVTCGYLPSLIFPCFDQPDIKATVKLRTIIKKELRIIANEKVSSEGPVGTTGYFQPAEKDGYRLVEFIRSKILPIHNFTLFIGGFESFKAKRNWKVVPVTFHCRPEFRTKLGAKLVDLEIVVHKTLDYFFNVLGVKYPFSKLDIVYTETPAPAIEYPGAILMSEKYLDKDDLYTRTDNLVILCHEIIHMWFGNITTCDFWDNIFIHESFAEYVSVIIYQTFHKSLIGSYQDPVQYFLLGKNRGSLVYASLPGSRAVKSDVTDLELANTVFEPVVYHKGEHLLYYFHDQWKDNFLTLLKRMVTAEQWGNLTYSQFLGLIPEGERPKFKLAFENKIVDHVEIHPGDSPRSFKAVRTQSSGLTWEQIGITFYDLQNLEAKVIRVDLSTSETHFTAPAEYLDFAFVFNQSSKAFCVWKDDPANAEKVAANASKLPDNEVLNYYLNLANYFIVKAEEPDQLLNFFKAAYPVIKKSTDEYLFKLLKKVLVHKARSTRLSEEAFRFLMSKAELTAALLFLTNRGQAEQLHAHLAEFQIENQELWKAFICQTHKIGQKDISAKALAEFESRFKDPLFAEHRATCAPETLDNEFMSLIMYRTGNKNLHYYTGLLGFMKAYLPTEKRVQLAIRFLKDFQSIARQVSKFYVQAVLKLVLPAVRTASYPELQGEFRKAAGQVATQPFLSHILAQRMQVVALYND